MKRWTWREVHLMGGWPAAETANKAECIKIAARHNREVTASEKALEAQLRAAHDEKEAACRQAIGLNNPLLEEACRAIGQLRNRNQVLEAQNGVLNLVGALVRAKKRKTKKAEDNSGELLERIINTISR